MVLASFERVDGTHRLKVPIGAFRLVLSKTKEPAAVMARA
jgi:hypothetical protein